MKLLIPTCTPLANLKIVDELRVVSPTATVIVNSSSNSAAFNRNRTLEQVELGELVIMLDDDMTGFFKGWETLLVKPFEYVSDIIMIAARLLRPNGNLAFMMGEDYRIDQSLVEVKERRLPTACIAFRYDGTMFYEGFIGSGFEDTAFCKDLGNKYPNGKFMVNNEVRLVHKNEMKGQKGEVWVKNKAMFVKLYPEEYMNEYKRD
mgnify:CR=1 FL=1